MAARRRRLVAPVVLLAVAALLGPLTAPVQATPSRPKPSAAQVAAARAAAARAADALAAARAERAAAQQRLAVLGAQLETAIERANLARAEADEARGVALAAAQRAAAATAAAAGAQRDADQLASRTYQYGADLSGGLGEWAAVVDGALSSGGIRELADRVSDLSNLGAARRHQTAETAQLRLAALQAEIAAQSASDDLALRERQASDAAAAVKAQQAQQAAEVARLTAQRDAAEATLARLRTRAQVLADQRAEALRAEAAARAAAAARARAEAAARARAGGRPPSDTGGSVGSAPQGSSITTAAQRRAAVAAARTQFGKPYVAGADGPDSYDCSGLTAWAYRQVGISLVHYSQSQYAAGTKIPVSALQPGDLVFFATNPSDWRTIHHVGIYAGGGQMIEAPHTGDVVKYMTIWQDELVPFGARP